MTAEARTQYAQLLTEFGEGWSAGDSSRIGGVFSDDAVFAPDPFGSEVRGRTAIEGYWKDIPFEQSEIAFRFGELFVVGPWFATEFRCTFRRRRTGERMDVRGAIFCETADGLISEMRMYYHRAAGA